MDSTSRCRGTIISCGNCERVLWLCSVKDVLWSCKALGIGVEAEGMEGTRLMNCTGIDEGIR